MPTAAKLVSAIYMAFAGLFVVMVAADTYPSLHYQENRMAIAVIVINLFIGWFGLGRRVAEQPEAAVSLGVRAGVTAYIFAIFVFALDYMISGMLKHLYYEPIDAVMQLPARMMLYGRASLTPGIVVSILALSGFGGVLARRISARWP